jgi:hypothetical protein
LPAAPRAGANANGKTDYIVAAGFQFVPHRASRQGPQHSPYDRPGSVIVQTETALRLVKLLNHCLNAAKINKLMRKDAATAFL